MKRVCGIQWTTWNGGLRLLPCLGQGLAGSLLLVRASAWVMGTSASVSGLLALSLPTEPSPQSRTQEFKEDLHSLFFLP